MPSQPDVHSLDVAVPSSKEQIYRKSVTIVRYLSIMTLHFISKYMNKITFINNLSLTILSNSPDVQNI